MKSLALKIVIGAALASGFAATTQKGGTLVTSMSTKIAAAEQGLSRIDGFRKLKTDTVQAEAAWKSAQNRVTQLAREIREADKPTKEMTRNMAAAKREAAAAKTSFTRQSQSLQTLRNDMSAAGQSTRGLSAQNRELATTYERLNVQQARMSMLTDQRDANLARRSELQGKLMGAAIMAATVAAPVKMAMGFESSMADVKKVVSFETPAQFKEMRSDILELSTKLPMTATGITEIYAAAGRAGRARGELNEFAQDAIRMSIAFDMSADNAASAMTGFHTIFDLPQADVVRLGDAINYLDNNMDATASGITRVMQRSGLMAQQFGLTAEQNAALAATFLELKIPVEVAATGINAMFNRLSTAEQQGAKFQEGLQAIGFSASEMKAMIDDDAKGALISFLEAVDGSEDQMAILSNMFGMEYGDDMVGLVGNLDGLKKAFSLVADEQAHLNSMNAEYESRAATSANGMILLKNETVRLAVNLGTALLPVVNLVGSGLGFMISVISGATERFPLLTTVIVGGTAALVTLRLVTLANAYATTFLKGAWLGAKIQLVTLRGWVIASNVSLKSLNITTLITAARFRLLAAGGMIQAFAGSLMTLARVAVPAVITGLRAMTIAMLFNPIGLIVTGIALGAALLIKYWTPISGFFKSIWDGVRAPANSAFSLLKTIFSWSPVGLIMRGWSTLPNVYGAVFAKVKDIAKLAMDGLKNFLMSPIKLVEGLWRKLTGLGGKAKQAATGIIDPLKPGLKSAAATAGAVALAAPSMIAPSAFAANQSSTGSSSSGAQVMRVDIQPSNTRTGQTAAQATKSSAGDVHLHLTLNNVYGDAQSLAEQLRPELERMLREAKDANLYD